MFFCGGFCCLRIAGVMNYDTKPNPTLWFLRIRKAELPSSENFVGKLYESSVGDHYHSAPQISWSSQTVHYCSVCKNPSQTTKKNIFFSIKNLDWGLSGYDLRTLKWSFPRWFKKDVVILDEKNSVYPLITTGVMDVKIYWVKYISHLEIDRTVRDYTPEI